MFMAKGTPFFSIVIPTKNRPDYLRDSIQSVLLQDFDDYELIVSDNFNEAPTQEVIHEFSGHPKFTSYRTTEEMNMISHWEFATRKATGKYVLLLADRKVYYQGALKKIQKELLKHSDINAFSFGTKIYNDLENKMGWNVPEWQTKRYTSSELLDNFLTENYFGARTFDLILPKTLNGGYKNAFASEVRAISGQYFNNPGVTTPDYSSLFINLALNDEVMHIGGKIMLWQGEQTSNGRQFGAGKFQSYMKTLGEIDPYEHVPIKAPFIYNLLQHDLWKINEIFGGHIASKTINWDNYFRTNYWELLNKKSLGLSGSELAYFEEAFNISLKESETKVKDFNKLAIEKAFHSPTSVSKLDKFKNFKYHLKDFVAHRFPNNKMANKLVKVKYGNVLEAGGFDK